MMSIGGDRTKFSTIFDSDFVFKSIATKSIFSRSLSYWNFSDSFDEDRQRNGSVLEESRIGEFVIQMS